MHRIAVAKRVRGRPLCFASIACRIGRLDYRAERCAEHLFRTVVALDVRGVRAATGTLAVWALFPLLRLQPAFQTDLGHFALRLSFAGLLATRAIQDAGRLS